jgi:integrase
VDRDCWRWLRLSLDCFPTASPPLKRAIVAKLTKRTVDAIRPDSSGGDTFVWDTGDGAIKGFGVRMKPSGVASFLVQYRTQQGRTRRLVLGRVGVLTPEQARTLATDRLKQVSEGGDPSADRHRLRDALTMSELADLYLQNGPAEKPNKKASSWRADRSNIERHIKPLLGRKVAKTLAQADVSKFQIDVASGKTKADIKTGWRGRAIIEGGNGTAARSLAVLGAMLQYAVNSGLISTNPAKGVPLLKGVRKERFLSEMEIAKLADVLNSMERQQRINPSAVAAMRLLMLTGCRKSEIITLRWNWVDFGRGCLRLPDSKTGAKVVPLAAAALELLDRIPRTSVYVLPGAKGDGHYSGLQKDWRRVCVQAELTGLRIHDLRHTFASFAVADGHTLFMVGKVLGHRQARTTEIYAHLSEDPLRAVANRTAARIAAAMRPPTDGAEVVSLRPGRSNV